MRFDELTKTIERMSGNYMRKAGDLYILPENIKKMPDMLNDCDAIDSILITPFLLNTENDALYELHYYEFEINVDNVPKSYYVEYSQGNILPKEITENIKPKAVIASEDRDFFALALSMYFVAMEKMDFEIEKSSIRNLERFALCYQIY